MKKNKVYNESEQLERRRNCNYSVSLSLRTNDGTRRESYQCTTFKGTDLLDCRAKAIQFYQQKIRETRELKEYQGLPLGWNWPDEDEQSSTASVDFEFENSNKDADRLPLSIYDAEDKEDVITNITKEYLSLRSLGYKADDIKLLPCEGVPDDEIKTACRVAESTMYGMH